MSTAASMENPTAQAHGAEQAVEFPCLTVVHHPDPLLVGRRVLIDEGQEVMLGRGADVFGDDVLDDDRLSRRHARVSRDGRTVVVEDQASRNGTTVNGRRVGVAQLRQGDVLGVGRLLLLLHWCPPHHLPPDHPRLVGDSAALAHVLREVERVAPLRVPVLVHGEPGSGRRRICYEVHRLSRKGTPYGVLEVKPGKDPPWERIVDKVGPGTLVLAGFEDASPELQAKVLATLKDPATCCRVLLTFSGAVRPLVQQGRFDAELAGMLSQNSFRMPPLRRRPEDILPLARTFARQQAGGPRHLSRRLSLMLLMMRWEGNVRELKEVMSRLVDEQKQHVTLRAPVWLADMIR
ncbi:MAG: FHA domain-containing protein [Alphaproteobacteria bacterium]|nr:FHA domain-containing protein [Alphaproteobacteria bacterium]